MMKKITGKVTGVTGEPLIGANVLAVGGKQATITNLEGEFSLEVSDNSKLQVTYIGYLPQEVDRKSTRLNSSHTALSRMPSSA